MATRTGQTPHAMAGWTADEQAPVWARARGEFVYDGDGREYIDMQMGYGACLWGHGTVYERILRRHSPEELAQGVGSQQTTELRERALEALCEWAARPWRQTGGLLQAALLHTGAEAVEAALKTALAATGRPEIVAFNGAYHGSFGVSAAASSSEQLRQAFASTVRFSNVRREPFGEVPRLSDRTACVIVEPIQGASGVTVPPSGFLDELRAECDRAGALLILDDVLAGAGRTGEPVEGVQCGPDMVVLAKAIGGGMICSALLCKANIAERAWTGDDAPQLSTTYYGHPFTCASILEVLALHEEHDLPKLCEKFERAVHQIEDRTPLRADGKGAFWGLDTGRAEGGRQLARHLLHHGVFVGDTGLRGEGITLLPSVLMEQQSLDRVVEAIVDSAQQL